MRFWTSVLCCSLAVLAVTSNQDDERMVDDVSDSLKTALDAVSRRQRDLANSDPDYYGLGSYRYPKENGDEMPFLAEGRDFNEDGQPENIGYGFQKSMGSSGAPGMFAPQLASGTNTPPDHQMLAELALEYLESELKMDNDEDQFYPSVNDAEKRSVFRERDMPERSATPGKFEDMRKRGGVWTLPSSSFRERAHHSESNGDKRPHFGESVIQRLEQEKEDADERINDDEYERMIETILEEFKESSRNEIDIEKLSGKELGELLEYLGENGASKEDIDGVKAEVDKRYGGGHGYGSGYDFFNNGATMNGGFGYKKRSKQILDDPEASSDAFLYSLKFVSPELNREAVEQMRENDGIDFSGESDQDILKLGLKYANEQGRQRQEAWYPAIESPEQEEYENNDNHQSLLPPRDPSKKRYKSAKYQDTSSEFLLPERHIDKKFLYDRAILKRKRFPVTKRSSNYYTSPPLLHHHVAGERKKKDAPETHGTDPKVASEISQIFSSQNNDNSNENVKIVPQIIGNHVVTKQKAVSVPALKVGLTATTEAAQYEQHNQSVIEDRPNEEEIELPVTMSRLEIPIEVKKKSIDWSDYFGLDRRRKKTGPKDGQSSNPVDEDWLLNQYYKSLALSSNTNKRPSPHHNGNEMNHKKAMPIQPFDTRIFDADIFQRNEAKKSRVPDGENTRIENMDSKLRNLEDLIVNEALKYTGAHQGDTDTREIQEVKDKVMTRLAAAYNLEKMRRALGEFKSSLTAQKMSKYNPEERRKEELEDKRKRVAVKKERAEPKEDKHKKEDKKRGEEEYNDFTPGGRNEGSFGEFIDRPAAEVMSEGYMGGPESHNEPTEGECPVLSKIVHKCRAVETDTGDHELQLLPVCALHQICYICGPEIGSPSPSSCDGLFLNKADEVCRGDVVCERTALRTMMELKRLQAVGILAGMAAQCWESFCTSQMIMGPSVIV